MTKITSEQKTELARLLAGIDVFFYGMRRYGRADRKFPNHVLVAINERRRTYFTSGVPWTIGGSAAERQAGARQLQSLASAGFIEIFKSRLSRRHGVKLTPRGHYAARYFALEYLPHQSWPLLQVLSDVATKIHFPLVGELKLSAAYFTNGDAKRPEPERLLEIEERMLPLLLMGIVKSTVDVTGMVFYYAGPAACKALAAGPPEPFDAGDWTKDDRRHGDEYDCQLLRLLQERETWRPTRPNEIYVPLPAGGA